MQEEVKSWNRSDLEVGVRSLTRLGLEVEVMTYVVNIIFHMSNVQF